MKTNQEAIVITERAADYMRLRDVLRDWGYAESEIHRVLTSRMGQPLIKRDEKDGQSSAVSLSRP